ncbi:hypothetical protein HGM15179_021800, partial [Zosterops borbonicus]
GRLVAMAHDKEPQVALEVLKLLTELDSSKFRELGKNGKEGLELGPKNPRFWGEFGNLGVGNSGNGIEEPQNSQNSWEFLKFLGILRNQEEILVKKGLEMGEKMEIGFHECQKS